MATPTRNTKSKRPTPRGLARGRGADTQPTRRRPQLSRSAGKPSAKAGKPSAKAGKPSAKKHSTLIDRAQASVPARRKSKSKSTGLTGAVRGALGSIGSGDSRSRARKPSKKGMAGIVAGASLGAAAAVKRRRDGRGEEPASTTPAPPAHSGDVAAPPPAA